MKLNSQKTLNMDKMMLLRDHLRQIYVKKWWNMANNCECANSDFHGLKNIKSQTLNLSRVKIYVWIQPIKLKTGKKNSPTNTKSLNCLSLTTLTCNITPPGGVGACTPSCLTLPPNKSMSGGWDMPSAVLTLISMSWEFQGLFCRCKGGRLWSSVFSSPRLESFVEAKEEGRPKALKSMSSVVKSSALMRLPCLFWPGTGGGGGGGWEP